MKRIILMTAALVAACLLATVAVAGQLEKQGQVTVGQTEMDLYAPEGLVRVQLPDQAAMLAAAGDYPPSMIVVALFVDPDSAAKYKNLKAGQTPEPPRVKAVITISPMLAQEEMDLDGYEEVRNYLVKYPKPYEVLENGPGLLTYKIVLDDSNVMAGRTYTSYEVISLALVNNKLLTFNIGSTEEKDFDSLWVPRAIAWRKAHQ